MRPQFPDSQLIAGPGIILCALPGFASAQNATWLAAPSSGDFNNPDNWTPTAAPVGPTGTATFNDSTIKTITFSQPQFPLQTMIGTLQFQVPGYTLETAALNITGDGIQATLPNAPNLNFFSSGAVDFQGTSTAGPAKITAGIATSTDDFDGGFILFHNNSTAGNATITALETRTLNFMMGVLQVMRHSPQVFRHVSPVRIPMGLFSLLVRVLLITQRSLSTNSLN